MKKLLSFLAAGVFALGLIGCSGDLHDVKASPLGVVGFDSGTDNIVVLMTMDNDNGSEQSLKFTWSSDATVTSATGTLFNVQEGWGKASGVQFKIILPEGIDAEGKPNWAYDRSYSDTMAYIEPGENYLALFPRGENGYSGAEGQNITISGLADGADYTLKALYDSSTGKVQVKVEGEASDPTQFRIVANDENSKNFPAKDKDGKDTTYSMSKAGDVYTYQFIAVADEDIVFSIKNDLLGTMAKNTNLSVKKDHEYKITFTKSAGTEGEYKSEKISLLKNAELLTNYHHSYDFYKEYDWFDENIVLFQAPVESFEFKVNRIAGDNTIMWGKGTEDISASDTRFITLKYVADSTQATVPPVRISGLKKDTYYYLKFEGMEPAELTAAVEEVPEFDDDLANFCFVGNITTSEWNDKGNKLERQSDGSYAVEFTAAQSSDIGKITTEDWGIKYGATTELKLGDTKLIPKILNGDPSITFSGLEPEKRYKLIVKGFLKDLVYMSVEEVQ